MEEGNDQETGEITVKVVSDDLLPQQELARHNSLTKRNSVVDGEAKVSCYSAYLCFTQLCQRSSY